MRKRVAGFLPSSERITGSKRRSGAGRPVDLPADPRDLACAYRGDDGSYYSYYSSLLNQTSSLADCVRIEAYRECLDRNADNFAGKVVLEVGCGLGLLTILAARAGARRVYAVEASASAAHHARRLVAAHGLENVVTVVSGVAETADIPEQVDIILSEFMGDFLLGGSMIESLVLARDKFLKPDGAVYPSRCEMFLAAACSPGSVEPGLGAYEGVLREFREAGEQLTADFDIDLGALSDAFEQEVRDQTLRLSCGAQLEPRDLLGAPVMVKEIDLQTAMLDEVRAVTAGFEINLGAAAESGGRGGGERVLNLWVGWFAIAFEGSPASPCGSTMRCDFGPLSDRGHPQLYQEGFVVHPPVPLGGARSIEGTFEMSRRPGNWRQYDVRIAHLVRLEGGRIGAEADSTYHLN